MKLGLQVWGSEGDVAPFTALAAGLVKAGHQVKLVVTDNLGRDYSGLARRFGYEIEVVAAPECLHRPRWRGSGARSSTRATPCGRPG